MATLTSGDTLSLNSLGGATGQSTKSLSAAKGNTTGPISLSSFAIDSVGSISGYTYAVENTSETYTLGFGGAGSNFGRISSRYQNFTWSVPVGSTISVSSNQDLTATFTVSNRTNAATQTILQGISSNTIRVVFADGFNHHATNYNTNRDKTVYSVDSYDGNSTALCLVADTPVTLANGTQIEIGDLEEGMELKGYSLDGLRPSSEMNVLEWNSETLNPIEQKVKVVDLVFSFAERVYNVNDGEITATAEHPMAVKDLNGIFKFKQIHNLIIGESLLKHDGSEVEITSIEIQEGTVEIVSLDVDGTDTYLANGYITHNKGGNSHTDLGAPGAPTSLSYNGGTQFLSWVAPTSTGDTGITAYEIQVDNNSNFSSPSINKDEFSTTSISLQGQGVSGGTNYARVRAIDHGLKGAWTSTLTFTF